TSLAGEDRCTFADEGSDSLGEVLGCAQARLTAYFASESLVEGGQARVVDGPLRGGQRLRRTLSEGGGERTGPIEVLTGRDDLAGQTPVEGVGGLQLLRRQRHPHGPMPTRRGGHECRGTAVGHEPDLGERSSEERR